MDPVVRIWKDPVWSKVISAAILAAIAALWAQVAGYLTLASMGQAAAALRDFLTTDYPFPGRSSAASSEQWRSARH